MKITDIFHLKAKGTVIINQIVDVVFELKQGDLIEIINPNGFKLQSSVNGLEHFTRQCFTEKPTIGILLDSNISKETIVLGAKVYLVKK